jgi:hypothetical protein
MTLETINHRRKLAGRAAALCCMFFLFSAVDGLLASFRQSANELRLLPGESTKVNGSAREGIRDPQDLEYVTDSEQIRLSVEKIHTGFWLGGLMWRGELTTSTPLEPGDYTVTVRPKDEPSGKPLTVLRVRIFRDQLSLQESADSIIQRYTGFSPWWSLAVSFPLALLFSGIVYLCSQKREHILLQEGKAEVYRIVRTEEEYEISFALGTRQGVHTGMILNLVDETGIPVGRVVVKDAYEEDATGVVTLDCPLKMGYLVALP